MIGLAIITNIYETVIFMEIIESRDNPKIKLYRKLVNSKKERGRYRLFPLEGSRLIFDALSSGAAIKQIFIAESRLEDYTPELGRLAGNNVKISIISEKIGNYICATENTQGIFAECGFLDNASVTDNLKKNGKYAVLYRIQDPGNAGMIIRTAEALGLDGVIFCGSCDVYNPKTVRATMGSLFRIPVFRDIDENSLFTALSAVDIKSFAAVVDKDAEDVKKTDFTRGGAVFIGNEGNGLDKDISSKCGERITIRMKGNAQSLNAAMAAGIIMWELMRCE